MRRMTGRSGLRRGRNSSTAAPSASRLTEYGKGRGFFMMKARQAILSVVAVSLCCGAAAAQQDQPASSYHKPIVRLDDSWLRPLAAPLSWREAEFTLGSKTRLTSPLLGFLLAPQRALVMPEAVLTRPNPSEQIMPPTFNDSSTHKPRFVILRLRW